MVPLGVCFPIITGTLNTNHPPSLGDLVRHHKTGSYTLPLLLMESCQEVQQWEVLIKQGVPINDTMNETYRMSEVGILH